MQKTLFKSVYQAIQRTNGFEEEEVLSSQIFDYRVAEESFYQDWNKIHQTQRKPLCFKNARNLEIIWREFGHFTCVRSFLREKLCFDSNSLCMYMYLNFLSKQICAHLFLQLPLLRNQYYYTRWWFISTTAFCCIWGNT